jgi:hypothetical protein
MAPVVLEFLELLKQAKVVHQDGPLAQTQRCARVGLRKHLLDFVGRQDRLGERFGLPRQFDLGGGIE